MSQPLMSPEAAGESFPFPPVEVDGGLSLTKALVRRRSRREFAADGPTRFQLGQLCWAAQGITDRERGLRTSPSAGATYPLSLFVVERTGVYRYVPAGHRLIRHLSGDVRLRLQKAAEDQPWLGEAPVCLVLTAELGIAASRYGRRRAWRYTLQESGHSAQNVLLQAEAFSLAGVPVGAFQERDVAEILGLPKGPHPIYLIPIGTPRLPHSL